MFHIAHLRPFEPNDEAMFPGRDAQVFYDFGLDTEEEFEVDEIIAHHWEGQTIEFYVRFKDRDIFWEAYENCKDGTYSGRPTRIARTLQLSIGILSYMAWPIGAACPRTSTRRVHLHAGIDYCN